MNHFSARLASMLSIVSLLTPSFAQAANTIYISHYTGNTVSVINIEAGIVVDTISGFTHPDGITTSGTGVYVANFDNDTVSIIDITNNELENTVSVGDGPYMIAINGTGAYVSNYNEDTVSVIDITDRTIVATVTVGSGPEGIAFSGTGVYIAIQNDDIMTIMDSTNNQVEYTIALGDAPSQIVINGTGAYVSNYYGDSVSVIDITNREVEATVSVGDTPWGIGSTGTGVYVANYDDDTVSVIDTANNLVERTLSAGAGAYAVGITGTGVFISNLDTNTVSVIDTTNQVVERTLTVAAGVANMTFTTDSVTRAPTLTVSSSVQLCDDLSVTYSLPELPLSSSVTIQFYNTVTHGGTTMTMNNSQTPSFSLDLENLTSSANVVSNSGDNSLVAGSYIVYLNYQDTYRNAAAQDTESLTVTACAASSSSSSVSTGGGGGGGRPTITPEYIRKVAEQRFGSSSSSSSSRAPLTVGGTRYDDVWTDTWFATFVRKIIELKIFEGYKTIDGTPLNKFGPADQITLGQLAKVGTILWEKKDIEPKPSGDEWFKPYIAKVQSHQISVFNGTPNALAQATRAQVVQTVIEALGFPIKTGTSPFADVSADHPNFKAIVTASMLGLIKGDEGADTFRPDEPINRAEVAKILSLALGNIGINYLDDMLSASPTSSSSVVASSSTSSTSSSASSVSSEALKSAAEKDIRHVITPNAHVRSDARINATIFWTAKFGQEFEVLRIVGDWAHVRVSDGGEGYVWAEYLNK